MIGNMKQSFQWRRHASPSVNTHDIAQLIDRHFDALSPELQRAARWAQQHPTELGLQSMRASAKRAGVAPATMTRLAQTLGFEGFEAFREPYQRALARAGRDNYVTRPAASSQAGVAGERLARLNESQRNNVESVVIANAATKLQAAADAMLAARRVLFVGLRGSMGVAYHLFYTYSMLARNGVLATDLGGTLVDHAAQLGAEDTLVAVGQMPYTRQTVEVVAQARTAGVPVIALTDSSLSPIARSAQHVLLFQAESPSFFQSMTGAQALAESLVAAVAERGGALVQQRLAERRAQLKASRAYWERPIRKAEQ